jgi:hypothetical protein
LGCKQIGYVIQETGLSRDIVKFSNLYLEESKTTTSIWSVDNDLATILLRRILRLDHGVFTILLHLDFYCEESDSTVDVGRGSVSNSSNHKLRHSLAQNATPNYNIH